MTTVYNQMRSVRLQLVVSGVELPITQKPLSEKAEARVQNILTNLNRKSTGS